MAKDRVLAHVGIRTAVVKPLAKHHATETEVFCALVPFLVSCDFME